MKRTLVSLFPAVLLAGAALGTLAASGDGNKPARAVITFRDVTKKSGIHFKFHTDLRRGRMIATMGGGVAAADYDGDGWLDLYFTGSANDGKHPERGPCGTLYHNNGDGTFTDVTGKSGIRSCGWQMGAAWVDVNSDGYPDLLVAGLANTRLWMNNGNGTFTEAPLSSGLDTGNQFTICAAAGDAFGDGRVSLYLLGYLKTSAQQELAYPQFQVRMPEDYEGDPGILLRQNKNGTWSDVTRVAGVANDGGKGTGAVFFDYDGDGKPDLFIANDRVSNRLYHNLGSGRFEDVTEETGAGARGGTAMAGMGIAVGDPFDSGWPSLYVTNFAGQDNTFYKNIGGELFEDATAATGTGRASWPYVQWGTDFADFDNDGWQDLYSVTGQLVPKILLRIATLFGGNRHRLELSAGDYSFRGPITLWQNDGYGRFIEASATAGDLAHTRLCARGSAAGDFDGDGKLDMAVAAISGGVRIFHNSTAAANHAIEILPVAGSDHRTVLGTKLRLTAGGVTQQQEFILHPSYASGSWVPLHFGLGSADHAEKIEVIPPWSTRPAQVFTNVAAGALYRLEDGRLTLVRRFNP